MKNLTIRIVFAVFFFAILWNCPAKADSGLADLVKMVQPATVTIYVLNVAGKPVAQGSGFFFKRYGHLITNYHVLGNAAAAVVRTPDGKEFNVKSIVAEDKRDDLIEALVDMPYGSAPYLIPAGAAPDSGDPVMVIGSPMGADKVVSLGSVIGITQMAKLGQCIVHSAHSFPGSSGSPVVNTHGEVIGIETAGLVGKPNIDFAIPVERFSGLTSNYRELKVPETSKRSVNSEAPSPNDQSEEVQSDMQMAEQGDPSAQVRLAARYEQGRDLSENCSEALSLYRKAADQGYLEAQFHLGGMYYRGECTGRDLGEAAKWLGKAAGRGYPDAQRDFGTMCFNGEGMARDRVTACMWMILAASRGNPEANNLLKLMRAELTPKELGMAREKARNWSPAH